MGSSTGRPRLCCRDHDWARQLQLPFVPQGYVSFVNKGVDQSSSLKDCSLLDIVRKVGTGDLPGDVEKLLRDNAGGHWNHSFFWKIMCRPSDTSGPGGDLKKKIEEDFGSVDAMREQFNARAAGRFGSGWAWLGLAKDNKLIVCDTMNQARSRSAMTGVTGRRGMRCVC